MKKSGVIVYNPAAGRYPSGMLVESAAAILEKSGWRIRLEQSLSGEHITALAKRAAQEKMDGFIIAGGDGSVNSAVKGLLGSDTALGVLPAGTANVWSQELGLPGLSWTRWMALDESARRLAEAEIHRADIGMCNEQPFLLWAGAGLDAFVVHRIEPRRRWEKHFAVVQYAASTVWHASYWHGLNLRVTLDGREITGHFLLALVSNVHLYAGGIAELTPDARLDDGQMDLWLFEGETLGDTVQRAWDILAGRLDQSERVKHLKFHRLQIESLSEMYLQMDGEPVEAELLLNFRVQPRAINILVPQQTPHQLFSGDR